MIDDKELIPLMTRIFAQEFVRAINDKENGLEIANALYEFSHFASSFAPLALIKVTEGSAITEEQLNAHASFLKAKSEANWTAFIQRALERKQLIVEMHKLTGDLLPS